ncbi:MAG: 3-phosphoshikimate 1-carboxyvinyltransferase [Vulcanimicrobiota bacterium]
MLPGSKSLSNRVLLLAALADGPTILHRLLDSDDVHHLRKALSKLGLSIQDEGGVVSVGGGGVQRPQAHLFLGNAGTAFRPLTAVLSATPGDWLISGEPRMCERPIGPLVDALRQWGAEIEYLGHPGFPPLKIKGRKLRGGAIQVDGSLSSQFVSALLMAAPLLETASSLEVVGELVSQPYVNMTLGQLRQFGVKVDHPDNRHYEIQPQRYTSPGEIMVEGDATAASYFLAAGAIGQGPVRVCGAGSQSVQGEIRFARLLEEMGAEVKWGPDWVEVSRSPDHLLRSISRDLNDIPDSAMTLAVLALFSDGPCEIRGVGNWRVKECDRQQALYQELRKLGARVEKLNDGLRVEPPLKWKAARVETYNDHRMAMCFSLAAFSPAGVTIANPACVSKTYPHYFSDFEHLTRL